MKSTYSVFYRELSMQHGIDLLRTDPNVTLHGERIKIDPFWQSEARKAQLACSLCGAAASGWVIRQHTDSLDAFVMTPFTCDRGRFTFFTKDHIIPKSLGGGGQPQNFRPACEHCNGTRSSTLSPEDLRFVENNLCFLDRTVFMERYKLVVKHAKRMKLKEKRDEVLNPYRKVLAILMRKDEEVKRQRSRRRLATC